MKAAVYVRVSTARRSGDEREQNPEVQAAPLIQMAHEAGWEVRHYEDRMSGSRTDRPGWEALLQDARRQAFKVVLVWRYDRAARSVKQLIDALEEFRTLGIDFISQREALNTQTPTGRLMYAQVAAFAEFERELIRERVIAGVRYAQEHGTRSGKPIGRPHKILPKDRIQALRARGASIRTLARQFEVSIGTIAGIVKP